MCKTCGFDPTKHKVILSDTLFVGDPDEEGVPMIGMHRHHDYTWIETEELNKLPLEVREAAAIAILAENLDWAYALTNGSDLSKLLHHAKLASDAYINQTADKFVEKLKEVLDGVTKDSQEEDPSINAPFN